MSRGSHDEHERVNSRVFVFTCAVNEVKLIQVYKSSLVKSQKQKLAKTCPTVNRVAIHVGTRSQNAGRPLAQIAGWRHTEEAFDPSGSSPVYPHGCSLRDPFGGLGLPQVRSVRRLFSQLMAASLTCISFPLTVSLFHRSCSSNLPKRAKLSMTRLPPIAGAKGTVLRVCVAAFLGIET